MKLRLIVPLFAVLFVAGPISAPSQQVVLAPQKFPLLMVNGAAPHFSGDKPSCQYFAQTFYGNPKSGKAYVMFYHNNDQGKRADESFTLDRVSVVIDDTANPPFALFAADTDSWTIHVSQAIYASSEGRCLAGITTAK